MIHRSNERLDLLLARMLYFNFIATADVCVITVLFQMAD